MRALSAVTLVLVVLLGAPALATPTGEPDAFLEIVPGDPPQLRATIIGANVAAVDCSVRDVELRVAGTGAAPFDPTEPLAILFVINTDQIFAGGYGSEDDVYDPTAAERAPLPKLETAIDRFDWKKLGPPKSTFEIVGYTTGAVVVKPRSPLSALNGAAFGDRKSYKGIGTDLVQGITLGLTELSSSTARRKVMIVVGDGNDTNNEVARDALPDLARQAHRAGVETFGIIYKTAVSSEGSVLPLMIPHAHLVASADGIATELAAINSRLTDRMTVTFPGDALDWDGMRHQLEIVCPGIDAKTSMVLPTWQRPANHRSFALYLLIAGVITLVIALVAARRGSTRSAHSRS